ncbi:hypothetical protein ACFYUL_19325 [Streptomyces sp. NPDC004311]|uniref:hypothetical protein n=1 Tax=Streptomyces sp. NPDC004311 TaxID=3364698 RepID=UPI0036AEBB8D
MLGHVPGEVADIGLVGGGDLDLAGAGELVDVCQGLADPGEVVQGQGVVVVVFGESGDQQDLAGPAPVVAGDQGDDAVVLAGEQVDLGRVQ